ncbi:MAG TPA: CvpA family protein [Verrucomicrobiae bacterium]|nr:CvpA family protein [Verrucomicrobiae bacterium]
MIAAATQAPHTANSLVNAINNLPFSWFDIALLAVLIFGVVRGRKNGMTKEIIPFFEWLAIVAVCSFGYGMAGQLFINTLNWGKTISYVFGYLLLAALVLCVFLLPRKYLGPRLEGSSIFGSGEYYLGILAGLIRYTCIVVFVLALLNAPYYSAADIAAKEAYNNRWFGGGLAGYSGDFIPDLQTIQASVFKHSLVGPFVKDKMDFLLIDTGHDNGAPGNAPPAKKAVIKFQ